LNVRTLAGVANKAREPTQLPAIGSLLRDLGEPQRTAFAAALNVRTLAGVANKAQEPTQLPAIGSLLRDLGEPQRTAFAAALNADLLNAIATIDVGNPDLQ
jgi:hypothetical protein